MPTNTWDCVQAWPRQEALTEAVVHTYYHLLLERVQHFDEQQNSASNFSTEQKTVDVSQRRSGRAPNARSVSGRAQAEFKARFARVQSWA